MNLLNHWLICWSHNWFCSITDWFLDCILWLLCDALLENFLLNRGITITGDWATESRSVFVTSIFYTGGVDFYCVCPTPAVTQLHLSYMYSSSLILRSGPCSRLFKSGFTCVLIIDNHTQPMTVHHVHVMCHLLFLRSIALIYRYQLNSQKPISQNSV
jgi:hypothetical protein